MTPINLLNALKTVIQTETKDLLLGVRTKGNEEEKRRAPTVFLGNIPSKKEGSTQQIPYVLARVLTGIDNQKEGETEESECKTRIVVTTYSEDGETGYIDALNVVERIRIKLLRDRVVGEQFILKLPLEYIIYEDDTGPYTIAEMVATWEIPTVKREVKKLWQE